ncbi:regulatory protein, lacI family [Amphibacillus marinus]|uniref:Regulatory protein, lacI family n=1 Tax=Amphibacillus marinus TaxID=872970 RepID=A0A1H8M3V2_9BACI|nr:LacI family DNA-binding transcriptional regulator [Amphibacillus marinus]SEO12062.1 regulatory protein, lacI family [Amphibacillus marinus]
MKVTAKKIAEELNLSLATVDRALHSRGNVSPKTVQRVLAKAKELNYKPNKSALFLSKRKYVRLAFLFPHYPAYFWEGIETGIQSALDDVQDYGFEINIFKTNYCLKDQKEAVEEIIATNLYNGLVICPVDDQQLTQLIAETGGDDFAIFTFNNDSPLSNRLSYVGANYHQAGRLAGEVLSLLTYQPKQLALIVDDSNTNQMRDKRQGFETFMAEQSPLTNVHVLKINNSQLDQSIRSCLEQLTSADGIYVACGSLAEVANAMTHFPEFINVKLIGHDMSQAIYQHLQQGTVAATICQNPYYQGILAVRTAFDHLMLEQPIDNKEKIVKLEIVTKENSFYYL